MTKTVAKTAGARIKYARLVFPVTVGKGAMVYSHLGDGIHIDGAAATLELTKVDDVSVLKVSWGTALFEYVPLTNIANLSMVAE